MDCPMGWALPHYHLPSLGLKEQARVMNSVPAREEIPGGKAAIFVLTDPSLLNCFFGMVRKSSGIHPQVSEVLPADKFLRLKETSNSNL
mmetsp:Transcript_22298/g.89878  ORF Transcript_22298/g.89878 Transcript_22298/m.89878 type:complete len:89 (+) Transcript_22298:301-567(+)